MHIRKVQENLPDKGITIVPSYSYSYRPWLLISFHYGFMDAATRGKGGKTRRDRPAPSLLSTAIAAESYLKDMMLIRLMVPPLLPTSDTDFRISHCTLDVKQTEFASTSPKHLSSASYVLLQGRHRLRGMLPNATAELFLYRLRLNLLCKMLAASSSSCSGKA